MQARLILLSLLWAWPGLAARFDPRTGELARRDIHRVFDERPPENDKRYLPPPTKDPWYQAPSGWEDAKPGAVLRTRAHAYPTLNIRNTLDVFQVLFRTTDTVGQPSWSVTTVFRPKSHINCTTTRPEACAHGVVSYQVPTDSADLDASPSFLLQQRDPYGEIRDLLGLGWFVSVPDYEGPLASFCAGLQAAHATLDAGRAVMRAAVDGFGLRGDRARLALWGYSGGAFATEFAAELAASYAPDLAIAGVAVGGASPNLTSVTVRMNGQDTAGIVVAGMLGITMQRPAERQYLESHLRETGPRNRTGFMAVKNMTGLDALYAYANQDVFDYFVNGRADWEDRVIQNLYDRDGMMGVHGVPNMPCFYYKAIEDEMSPVIETDVIVDRFCSQGANILYHRNTLGGHNAELWSGRPRTYDFLSAVLDGTSNIVIPKTGCLTVNVSVPLDPLYLLPDWYWTEGLDKDESGVSLLRR